MQRTLSGCSRKRLTNLRDSDKPKAKYQITNLTVTYSHTPLGWILPTKRQMKRRIRAAPKQFPGLYDQRGLKSTVFW
ncbi:hypothetical protein FQA47_010649 [Oryzias melastigma]|uniref:Uncharacterized protein n=1 Tax=Oryzias melastigma TaxID=30732 RepID=A0A834BQV5_ORYME|nr:hypothetical protein FQA47_010649 [Oryzias melastigma]